jgi:hypothetical protein
MVATHQLTIADSAQRQGRTAMGAKVLNSRHFAFRISVEHHAFIAHLAAQWLVCDFRQLTGDIPSIFKKHI